VEDQDDPFAQKVPWLGQDDGTSRLLKGHSDFFTLDPNLASALRRIRAGVFSAAKAQPERGQATQQDGIGGETGVE
jgi:hypothetical protein